MRRGAAAFVFTWGMAAAVACSNIVGADFDHGGKAANDSGALGSGVRVAGDDAGSNASAATDGTAATAASDGGHLVAMPVKVGRIEMYGTNDDLRFGPSFMTVLAFGAAPRETCAHHDVGNGCTVQVCPNVAYDDPEDDFGYDGGAPYTFSAESAGAITLTRDAGYGGYVAAPANGSPYYTVGSASGSPGETLTVQASGAEFPAFSASFTLPNPPTFAVDNSTLVQSIHDGLTMTWSGGDTGADTSFYLILRGPQLGDGSPLTGWALCSVPAAQKTLTIPAAAWSSLGPGVITADAYALRQIASPVAGGVVYLEATERALSSTGAAELSIRAQ